MWVDTPSTDFTREAFTNLQVLQCAYKTHLWAVLIANKPSLWISPDVLPMMPPVNYLIDIPTSTQIM